MILQALVHWIYCLIDIFRRIHYSLHGAIEVTGVCDPGKTKGNAYCFNIEHEGQTRQVYVVSPRDDLSTLGDYPTALWWIPGKNRAMRSVFENDPESRRKLLFWDIVSAVAFLLLIAVFVAVYVSVSQQSGASTSQSLMMTVDILFIASIVVMIVAYVKRKKLRK